MDLINYKFRNKTEEVVASNISSRIINKMNNLDNIILESHSGSSYMIKYILNNDIKISGSFIPIDCVNEDDIKELNWKIINNSPAIKTIKTDSSINLKNKKLCNSQENKLKKKTSSQTSKTKNPSSSKG